MATRIYLEELLTRVGDTAPKGEIWRLALFAMLGLAIDLSLFNILLTLRADIVPAHLISFAVATHSVLFLKVAWARAETSRFGRSLITRRYLTFLVICLLAAVLRGALLAVLVDSAGWQPQLAILPSIATSSVVLLVGIFFILPQAPAANLQATQWRVFALCVVAYVLALRLLYSGIIDLIPEEAYYWLYSRHLDIGYLDHPPMVSWLIRLGTTLLGHSEIGVRIFAFLCWIVTAVALFRLARNLFDTTAAFLTLLLVTVLPIYFGTGLLMTPDAPLYAAWAATLYFLERALIAEKRSAWWGVGVCLGLGMLSKYTIALLGLATLAFVLVDRRSWRWLIRPEPYLAAGLAALIFSPVVLWNATHEWASFVFQGKDRWSGTPDFSLHLLVLSALLLLTPTGLVAIFANLFTGRATLASSLAGSKSRDQTKLFAQIFTLVPLAIFVLHSLQGAPKLNWTGPVWLAALPLLGWSIAQCGERGQQGLPKFWHKLWRPTVVTLLLVYGGGLYWLFLGLPGLNSMAGEAIPVAWQETADIINQIQMKVQQEDGVQSIFSGLDKYFISSEFAFYGNNWNDIEMVSGRHLFGMNSLMFGYWSPSSNFDGKTIMVASFKKKDLDIPMLRKHFTEMSETSSKFVVKNSHLINTLYYRLGYNYSSIVLPLAKPQFALKSIDPGMKQERKPIALHGLVHGPVPKG